MVNQEIEQLKSRVLTLESLVRSLTSGSSIPLNIDQALNGRGFIKVTSKSTASYPTQNMTITTTPQTITPPAQPSGTIAITIAGTVYKIPFQ